MCGGCGGQYREKCGPYRREGCYGRVEGCSVDECSESSDVGSAEVRGGGGEVEVGVGLEIGLEIGLEVGVRGGVGVRLEVRLELAWA